MRKSIQLGFLLFSSVMSAALAEVPADGSLRPSHLRHERINRPLDRIIVKFRPGVDAAASSALSAKLSADLSTVTRQELRHIRATATGARVMGLAQPMAPGDVEALARSIATLPTVEYAEPDRWEYPKATPNDPEFVNQWHLSASPGGINAPAAWDITTGSVLTVVAVLDTGYTSHPDLNAKWLAGYDFIANASRANDGDGRDADASDAGDWVTSAESSGTAFSGCDVQNSSWHGTKVAGIIGASTQNNRDIAGIDWAARILPVRVLGKCGGRQSDIADAMLWAGGLSVAGVPANPTPAKILNLSLGSAGACPASYQSAITQLTQAGKIVVIAAGNDNTSADDSLGSCIGVINVAATTQSGSKAGYSNFGPTITLAAPGGEGGDLVTLGNTGTTTVGSPQVVRTSGTSFSAPVVSGILSLMAAIDPNLDPARAKRILTASVRPFPDATCTTGICGAGIVDAAAAVRLTRDQSIGVATFVSFQDADVGKPNADLRLTITNFTFGAAVINSATISAGGADFFIAGDTCSSQPIAAGGTCEIALRFNPAGQDQRAGELLLSASDGRNYRVALSGFAYASARITQQKAGTSGGPLYIAKAPDGSYWYTQSTANRIARMTPAGQVTEYVLPTASSNPFDIAAGADGNMWFTQLDAGRIGRITPTGEITEFSLPSASSQPRGITRGPDGNIWFTEIVAAKIGRITPQGGIAEFTIPWAGAAPRGITTGPDGNLWFTDSGGLSIGKLTPSGTFTRFSMPWVSSDVRSITTGQDGNLWFTELTGNRLGRVTTAGVFTEFPLPRSGTDPLGIATGPDGGIWFTGNSANRVGRIDTATGRVSEFRLPQAGGSPVGITVGPNNLMWIANSGSTVNAVSSLSIAGVSGAAVYSDLWWGGTSENGWGMTIQQHGNTQFNVFFVYDGSGKPIWYAMPGGTWNTDYTVFSGILAKPTSAPLNNYNPAQFNPGAQVGTMNITYSGPATATLQYVINGIAGQKTILRQPFGPVDNAAGLQVGDMWWGGTAQDGWGVSITQQYRTLFAAWYTYDANGNVTWYTLPGGSWSGNTYSGTLATATSSAWLGQTYNPAQFASAAAGTVSFNFSDANNAVMTYTFTSGPFAGTTQTKQLTRQPY